MKRNLVGKILGKIKIFVQDFVPIRTALSTRLPQSYLCVSKRERLYNDRKKGKRRSTIIVMAFTAAYWDCFKRNLNVVSLGLRSDGYQHYKQEC